MRILIDTQIIIWSYQKILTQSILAKMNEAERVCFSPMSIWEIAIKKRKYRHAQPSDTKIFWDSINFDECLKGLERETQIFGIRHTESDFRAIATMPGDHSDPFDLALISTAINRNMALMSSDTIFPKLKAEIPGFELISVKSPI